MAPDFARRAVTHYSRAVVLRKSCVFRIEQSVPVPLACAGIIDGGPLAQLLPPDVAVFETRTPDIAPPLLPEERQHVINAVPKRVREFRAGRACARAALQQLGIERFAVHAGSQREPIWPPGVVGSITHTLGYAAAAVGRTSSVRAVGIDAERSTVVERSLWNEIATGSELERLAALAEPAATVAASVLFSAKEAFYKCQFPLTGEWLDFHDIRIEPDPASGFEIVPCRPLRLQLHAQRPWRGRFWIGEGLVLTAVCLR